MNYVLVLDAEHLDSPLSQPQDACNTDAPESSGNSNPTATLTNPPADQLETLTVETPIPIVSSPVLTLFFTDSQEPSSETRLISKRVTNQAETPSLDNILTFSNQFEDILRVTTNSEETSGVEADVSNMETTITASPTPTLRIHRDHPKSQIIGHVDTPKPKKISDALQDPSWVESMQEELLQFKIQKVWSLVDCPKGVRPIRTKWVLKNKKDERGNVIRNKARLVAQGHTQEEGIDYDEVFTPIARIEAIRLFLAYASFMGFTIYQMDVKSVFLYGIIDEEVYVMQPPRFQDPKSSNPQLCREFKALMHEKIQMSALGELNFFLGMQVLQKEDGIFLSQDKYVVDILRKFRYSDVRSSNTPMDKENPWGKDGAG
nr:putative ribonuclease H-like domain-containing protein [Tanacetum cinerariifolium]